MMRGMTIRSRFRVLVAEKELREGRTLAIRTIAREAGAIRQVVQQMLNNTMRHLPLDDLARLCRWLPCLPGDMLELVDDPLPDVAAAV